MDVVGWAVLCTILAGWSLTARAASLAAAAASGGVRVQGQSLVDTAGRSIVLRGVSRMGTEYACIQGWGIFDGTKDRAGNAATLKAMAAWHINAVRVPLNEDCWLDRETNGLDEANLGVNYQAAIRGWVDQITGAGMVAVVGLHWSAPKGVKAESQQPMADADNATDFWRSVAGAFKDNHMVIFDVFNEPYLDHDSSAPPDPWPCWRNGCRLHLHQGKNESETNETYEAAGMQHLVDAVRSAGAANPIMLGGLDYADRLDGIAASLPSDPEHQLIAAWHPYPGKACGLDKQECWKTTIAPLAETMPVLAGEFGRDDCTVEGIESFLTWMDQHKTGYFAWVWTVISNDDCIPGNQRYDLITNYDSGKPTAYGEAVQAHYQRS
jgi:hypothetical protein